MILRLIFAVAMLAGLTAAAPADRLERSAPLLISMGPPDNEAGVAVATVATGGTADRLGVKAGDRLLMVNGVTVADGPSLTRESRNLRANRPATLTILRNGNRLELKGSAVGRPFEVYDGATVRYGAVPFERGWLRDIYVAPAPDYSGPVLWYIQGYPCSTVESAHYRQAVGALLKRGLAVYRVEKPLVGDSQGTSDCTKIDFAGELAAFEAAYRHLTGAMKIDPDRLFILGHSMGGVQAPLIAARAAVPPRGVAVFGTVLRNWYDYMTTITAFQDFELSGADPVEAMAKTEALRPALHEFYFGTRTLEEAAAASPEMAGQLRELGWQGGEIFIGRSFRFWRDLAHLRLGEAWKATPSRVLSLFGESDLIAYNEDDHRLIAELVNHYRPGTAEFRAVPGTDHGMYKVGDRAALRERNRATPPLPPPPFNPEVADIIAGWIAAAMKAPPVRLAADSRAG